VYRKNTLGPKLIKTSVNRVRIYSLTLYCKLNRFSKDITFSYSTLRHDLNALFWWEGNRYVLVLNVILFSLSSS